MIVSKTPNIKIPVSILAVEATAGFIISTNGLTRNSDISERDIAIPLKKPATPIPNVNHIFSHRDDTKSINANTGKDDTKQYPVYLTSVSRKPYIFAYIARCCKANVSKSVSHANRGK